MQRLFAIILVSLTIAVTLAALPGAWQTAGPAHGWAHTSAADPAVGYAFYHALDRVLTGESDSLSETVTADFVDHSDAGTSVLPAETLVDRLQTMGQSFPGARLEIERVRASGNMLVAVVTPVVPGSGQVAGATFSTSPPVGGVEILGVERGRVSERWATPLPPPALATTFEPAALGGSSDATLTARLFRITLSEGQAFSWRGEDPGIAMVESGTVAMTAMEHVDEPVTSVRQAKSVTAGTAISVPQGASLRTEGGSDQRAQFLFFAVHLASSHGNWTFRLDGGAKSELLWKSSASFELAGPWSITAGRVALPPERVAELGNTANKAMILAAQGGPVHLTTENGMLAHLGDRFRMSAVDASATMSPGEAIQTLNADSVTLESISDHGVSVWLIMFGPIAPEGGDAGLLPGGLGEGDELPVHQLNPRT